MSIGMDPRFFIACLNDADKTQVKALNVEMLVKDMDDKGLLQDDRTKIIDLFGLNKMSEPKIMEKCIEIRPYMENVFDVWSNSPMKNFILTSVGIAIGHANIKRLVGEFANLSIWIN